MNHLPVSDQLHTIRNVRGRKTLNEKMKPKENNAELDDQIEVSAGTVLFEEESMGETMYVVIEGEVVISLHGKSICVATAGELVGEMALLKSSVRSATATAKTDCVLNPINKERFESMIQISPSFALYVMNVLADRLRLANETLTS